MSPTPPRASSYANPARRLPDSDAAAAAVGSGDALRLDRAFEQQVVTTPDRVAVLQDHDGAALTYAQLNHQADQLARRLVANSVGPETMVALLAERSARFVVALLGILKAGGTCVPLHPAYPPDRLATMLTETHPALLLCDPACRPLLKSLRQTLVLPPLLTLDEDGSADDLGDGGTRQAPLAVGMRAGTAAFVFFTSGSTGTPLPVVLEHGAICRSLCPGTHPAAPGPDDRALLLALCSTRLLGELLAPLLVGATVVVAGPGPVTRDGAYLVAVTRRRRLTRLQLAPATLRLLLDQPSVRHCTSLRDVFCRGEELPFALARRFFARLPAARLHHLYGQTETGQGSMWTCDPQATSGPVPIGRWPDSRHLHLLDDLLQPVPPGVVGEIYLGGDRHARGYLNRPELTAAKFPVDPRNSAERLCRTGDLGRARSDGTIEFCGRAGQQLTLPAGPVHPHRVERACLEHPAVAQAAVTTRPTADGTLELVAYLVANTPPPPSATTIQAFLAQRLPVAMHPTAITWVDRLPLQPGGKLDRRALSGHTSRRVAPLREGA